MKKIFLLFLIIIFAFGLVFQVQADADPVDTQGTVQAGGEIPPQTPPQSYGPPALPSEGFGILINQGVGYTNNSIVTLTLKSGLIAERMAISNFSDFRDAGQETYVQTKTWNLCQGLTFCPEGKYTVYVKFYTSWGTASEVVSYSIIYKKPISKLIFEEIKQKLIEISERISDLRNQIAQFFLKKEAVVETPEIPSEFGFWGITISDTEKGSPIKLIIKIENKGNQEAGPTKVRLKIFDKYHSALLEESEADISEKVRPFQIQELSVEFPTALETGQYWGEFEIYKDEESIEKDEQDFYILEKTATTGFEEEKGKEEKSKELPYLYVGLGITAVLILGGASWFFLKRK